MRWKGPKVHFAPWSEKQSPGIVAADIFMTESGQPLSKDLAGNLHAFHHLVTRAATDDAKLASVDEN